MKLRSRGLGRKELIMDFREYDVTREGDEVLVTGTIKKPVHWDFSIRMSPDDIPGMLKVAFAPATIGMFFRWLNPFKKTKADGDEAGQAGKSGASSTGTSSPSRTTTDELDQNAIGQDATGEKERPNSRAEKKAAKAAAKASRKAARSSSDEEGTAA